MVCIYTEGSATKKYSSKRVGRELLTRASCLFIHPTIQSLHSNTTTHIFVRFKRASILVTAQNTSAMITPKRRRTASGSPYSADEWELTRSGAEAFATAQVARPQRVSVLGERCAPAGHSMADDIPAESVGKEHKRDSERMGGLSLPDVVRQLLQDSNVLKWHPREEVYEVTHGDNFEQRSALHSHSMRLQGMLGCLNL